MTLKSFRIGGIHPPENKLSKGAAIEAAPLPARVAVPLGQHIGVPSAPVVAKGDTVKVGTLIARAEGFVSSNVHSPVSGTVVGVEDVMSVSGYKRPALIIDVDGDEWEPSIDRSPDVKVECTASPKEIVARIVDAGIIGMGGAGFPTHVKFSVPEGRTVTHLVVNGVECEPYLTADHRLMLEKTEQVIVGVSIMMKALNVKTAIIGIEANKPDAIALMTEKAKKFPGIVVQGLKVRYPQGAEKQLIKAVTGREVPSGKLPLDVGCVVDNVGTAFAIYEAVQKNKPLFERVVTVTGKSVKKPSNVLARIGVSAADLIAVAGGLPESAAKIISGGPMMGKTISTLDVPVTKGTSGLLIVDKNESIRAEYGNCIRCGRCVNVCPMGLEPYLLEKQSSAGRIDDAEFDCIADCVECGCCTYTCPANRPLLDWIRQGKAAVLKQRKERSTK